MVTVLSKDGVVGKSGVDVNVTKTSKFGQKVPRHMQMLRTCSARHVL